MTADEERLIATILEAGKTRRPSAAKYRALEFRPVLPLVAFNIGNIGNKQVDKLDPLSLKCFELQIRGRRTGQPDDGQKSVGNIQAKAAGQRTGASERNSANSGGRPRVRRDRGAGHG